MGIPYYFYTLTKSYHGIVSNVQPVNPDIYCIDFNGIIHPVSAKLVSESEIVDEHNIIEQLYKKVKNDIEKIKPKQTVVCVDGVAPVAKMIQQRKRRYLTVFRNKIDNNDVKWDTNCITPGTNFMKSLNVYFKKQVRYNSLPTKMIYSGSDEPGEGEHKIFTILQKEESHTSVMINGLDADLIILCLMSHRKNIYLMRESEENTYVCIDNLRIAILQELANKWKMPYHNDAYTDESKDIIESYCVLCSLLGNDFIPHLLTLNLKTNGLDKLLTCAGTTYVTYGILVQESKINHLVLCDILQQLSKNENNEIYEETEKYLKKSFYTQGKSNSDFYAIKNKDEVANKIYGNISNWRHIYYKHIFYTNTTIDSSVISMACNCYITGIYWTYAYYKKSDYDNTWYYPYAYPPTLRDISNYAIGNAQPIMQKKLQELSPNLQLMIVLPIESKHILESKYQKMIEDSKYGISHLYPKEYKIHTYLKTHLWESAPILPIINIEFLRNHIN